MRPLLRAYYGLHTLFRELMKFGVVGAVTFVVDVSVFNLARLVIELGPLTSKTVSVVVATTVAYLGNRAWTFRHRDRRGLRREYTLFFAFNAVGLIIALVCLGFTFYALELRSPLAQNVAANGVGLVLATAFRFWSYRRFVFPETNAGAPGPENPQPSAPREPDGPPAPTQNGESISLSRPRREHQLGPARGRRRHLADPARAGIAQKPAG